jgi:thioredoxin-dependent peroxiredoxin
MTLIEVGAVAPDIQATTGSGKEFSLADQTAKARVMLVFYPKDFTPGCTTQLVNVQRSLDDMRAAGVEPFGVNPEGGDSHQRYCDAYDLSFDILVDENEAAAAAYGAIKPEGGILRSVFVIGQDGRIAFAEEGAPSWDDVAAGLNAAE